MAKATTETCCLTLPLKLEKWQADKEALHQDYPQFVILHDQCIEDLKKAAKTLASMGIARRAS